MLCALQGRLHLQSLNRTQRGSTHAFMSSAMVSACHNKSRKNLYILARFEGSKEQNLSCQVACEVVQYEDLVTAFGLVCFYHMHSLALASKKNGDRKVRIILLCLARWVPRCCLAGSGITGPWQPTQSSNLLPSPCNECSRATRFPGSWKPGVLDLEWTPHTALLPNHKPCLPDRLLAWHSVITRCVFGICSVEARLILTV